MCVMIVSSTKGLSSIIEKLSNIDVSHVYFYNVGTKKRFGVPLISLIPFTNMLVCEDAVLSDPDFKEGLLLHEARRMNIPVLSETGLNETMMH